MGNIIWLASYPKSGNTWFRIFLTNLRGDNDQPADINDLDCTPIASARESFDDEVGIEASDLTPDEIDRLRPAVYETLAAHADEPLFMKVHDAYTLVDGASPLFPKTATRELFISFAIPWMWRSPSHIIQDGIMTGPS